LRYIQTSALEAAERYIPVVRELPGEKDHPLIRWWHSLCGGGEQPDEVPWCSSFANGIAFELGLERSRSKAARSWLEVGEPIYDMNAVEKGLDVVILQRGDGPQPGATVLNAPGHVGFFAGWEGVGRVFLVGGNQGDRVSRASFPRSRVLGVRRLRRAA
jgi:uncharacterized protein (TIGR02594 family)